ncbi:MAG TPA: DUF5916 domain-containing protein, partial [Longimicrobium sp.]|nr:DUF5916 domain-containing protein [Longimicrobium sp.]
LGLLEVVTAPEYARYRVGDGETERLRVEPMTNYAVGRASKDFRAGQSAVGVIATATHRDLTGDNLDFLRSAAYTGGVDARHRFAAGQYEATGWVVGSRVVGSRAAIQATQLAAGHYFRRPDADHLEYDSTRTSLQGYAAEAQVAKIGGNWTWKLRGNVRSPEFEINDLGFLRNSDRITEAGELKYSRYQPGRVFRSWNLALNQGLGWTFGGEAVERFANVNSAFQFNNFWGGFVLAGRTLPVLSVTDLRGGSALRTIGSTGITATLYTDRRRKVSGSGFAQASVRDEAGGWNATLAPAVTLRPSPRWELSAGPQVTWNVDPAQYVDRRTVAGEMQYFVGRLEQTTTSLTARLNYTFARNLSFQFYAQPFISAGDFTTFRQVASPRAGSFGDRFRTLADDEVQFITQTGRYRLDLNDDGTFDTDIRNPSFNVKQLRSNAVLRWEYRPGSTVFVIWNQGRQDFRPDGSFALDRDAGRLFDAEGTNVLLIKFSYWLNM